MITTTVSILAVTALSLVFPTTRWMGIAGVAVLTYLHPWLLIISLVAAVVAAIAFHLNRKRSYDALPSPDPDSQSD